MQKFFEKLPRGWPYVASIALTKGFSLIAIPLLANLMVPAEFGRLDVAASLIEFLGIIFAMGLADTLIRFTSLETKVTKRNQIAAEIMGTAIVLTLIFGIIVQCFVPIILNSFALHFDEGAMRTGFLGATLSGLITLPLAWVRLKDQPFMFLIFTGTRGILQATTTIAAAYAGYGVEGILYSNAAVDIIMSLVIFTLMTRETGILFRLAAFKRSFVYGMPLVGGALAMFVMGTLDRWFLVDHAATHDLAHYAIATKLALATPLLMQPFGLWWYAQRLRVLEGPDGLQRSANIVGTGFTVLLISATAVSLLGPLFIHYTMPHNYLHASTYLPWVIGIMVLHESNSLLNVGVYRKNHTFIVLGINTSCALVALFGYWLFVPDYGIWGAIGPTIAAQILRLILFVTIGYHSASIPYPFMRTGILAIIATFCVWFSPSVSSSLALISWSITAICLIGVCAIMLGLIRVPLPRKHHRAFVSRQTNKQARN